MIRNNFTSASINFGRKHEAEKQAIQQSNLRKGILMVTVLPIVFLILSFIFASKSHAQNLPPNPIGIVNYTTPSTYVNYSYSFTAPTTGVDYFGVAIRQDPGYWGIGNFSITTGTSLTNLLQNPNLQYGGTTNTQYGLQAPADWGIWYQSAAGAPPAAGMYYAPGQGWMGTYTGGLGVNTSTAGTWIDGAVGTFDGIYQGINVTSGITYNFSFSLNGTQTSTNPSIEIGAYAGPCSAGTNPFTCTPSSSSGFTAAATPAQTQGTGGAPPPSPPPSSGPVFTDLRFGQYQVADSQWNVSSCTQTNTCQIYSTNPGTAYRIPWTSGQWNWQPGQYIQFSTTGDATNPYQANVYNSDGTLAGTIGTGHILSMGTDSSGHSLFFFVGNDNNTGQLFSTNYGFSGNGGYTWTGTLNPSNSQVDTFASSGSTTPLASGQSSGGSSAPTVTSTSTSDSVSSSSNTTTSSVTNQYTNNSDNYSFTGKIMETVTTTNTTPVTTTNYSDGTSTTSNGTTMTTTTTTDNYTITPGQSLTPADLNRYRGTLVNAITINQTIGSTSNTIQATQKGQGNDIEMTVSGVSNKVSANQGFTVNSIGVPSESTMVSNNNFAALNVSGNNNNVTSQQTGLMNSVILGVTGNYNTATTIQNGNNNQGYTSINGNNNTATVNQNGNGNLSAVTVTGPGNNITVGQAGNNNGALINVANQGGASTVNLLQQAQTQGQTFVVQQTCTNGAGCSVSVQQNR